MNYLEQNDLLKATLIDAIKQSGALIQEKFYSVLNISYKDQKNNLVTDADKASEELIIKIIKSKFPGHGIIGEEFGTEEQKSDYKWVIDPIDGTVNFAHGIPLYCVSIAVMHHDQILMGAIFNPILNELFFAEKGKGALLNDEIISVSKKNDFNTAFLVTGFPYKFPASKDPTKIFERLIKKGLPIRRLGSAALDLCWVACGRFDAFWEFNLQPWDIAAGYLIVEEAGGKVTDFNNHSYSIYDKETLASNGLIHNDLLKEIALG